MRSKIALLLFAAFATLSAVQAFGGMKAVGAPSETDVQDANTIKAAAKAMELLKADAQLLNGLGASQELELVKIERVHSQVVAGIKYYLEVVLREPSSGREFAAELQLWSRPWMEAKNDPADPAWQLISVRNA